jgi:glucokinase
MRFAIGVDLGGTSLRVAAVREDGHVLDRATAQVKLLAGRDAVIDELCREARALIEKHHATSPSGGQLAGIGVGVPGIIYLDTGRLRKSPNLPGWEDFPVRDEIERRLGCNVILDNDANVAAAGEHWLGAGRALPPEADSLCLITLGTGVGGGLILDGKIWHGFLGMAGELGHINVLENGAPCGCGSRGCLETEASATAVVRMAMDVVGGDPAGALARAAQSGEQLTAELVFRCAQAGDEGSRQVYARLGNYLGLALAGLVNSLNLPLYVIGGGVAAAWPAFAPAMLEQLKQRSYIFAEGRTRVVPSTLHGDAGLLGAARLALQ